MIDTVRYHTTGRLVVQPTDIAGASSDVPIAGIGRAVGGQQEANFEGCMPRFAPSAAHNRVLQEWDWLWKRENSCWGCFEASLANVGVEEGDTFGEMEG